MDWLIDAVFRRVIRTGSLTVITARGRSFEYGDRSEVPVRVRFTSPRVQTAVALDPELRLGEAYMDGHFVIEEGSIADFLRIVIRNLSTITPTAWAKVLRSARTGYRRVLKSNRRPKSSSNARHHYDISFEIYKLFLDRELQYSCAYFEDDTASIEQAQKAKLRHIASKLVLTNPGLRVLDVGCGWGGLALSLAQYYGASVTGISLSPEQIKVANRRKCEIEEQLSSPIECDFKLQDFRETGGSFDRIVSVGMFEHVGRQHYPTFFRKCFNVLSDNGIMLLHTIARSDGPSDTNAWVWKYIFPGGYTPSLSELAPEIEQSGLILCDLEVLRIHYAKTLAEWRERFLANRDEALRIADSPQFSHFVRGVRFVRMWEFYLAAFEVSFEYYGLMVFQLQLTKDIHSLPLTRKYMYAEKSKRQTCEADQHVK